MQYGVVSRKQMRELGYSEAAIGRAAASGRLHRLHRGVYAVGHMRLSVHGRCRAAVLACGANALLSHFAAGWLWGLLRDTPGEIDVTRPTRGHQRHSIRVHHAPALSRDDCAVREDIPVTALPRT
ncbi:MAG: type IV toxin-antitoxin system AbiEi family antitoxin domain-containing protein, partial [Burkholderiales bacterium]|nr:type IV toxin-antitoxin system AbiEi family antitoxin domain-containing protein [Burkholderiales bacterium]